MSIPVFKPSREADLVAWSDNFSTRITATPTAFGLTAAQALTYAGLHLAFANAYETATNPATNSHANIVLKNSAKQSLLNSAGGARALVDIVQAFPATTNFMRAELNIRVRDVEPTPVPVPSESPEIDIVSATGHSIRVRLHGTGVIGKPPGVKGATLFTHVGATPPSDLSLWHFQASITRNVGDLSVPAETPAGALVWITAFWFNARMESGPAATPISTNIPGGLSAAA